MYKCGAVLKGETVQIKKKQDKENRVELDSKDHSIKKTSEEISLKIYNLSCMCR